MSLLMVCDAPGCFSTTPPVVRLNRPAAPVGWWMQCAENDRIICACSEAHLLAAIKAQQRGA